MKIKKIETKINTLYSIIKKEDDKFYLLECYTYYGIFDGYRLIIKNDILDIEDIEIEKITKDNVDILFEKSGDTNEVS